MPPDYSFYQQPGEFGRGGDVGFLVTNKFIKSHSEQIYSSFEAVCIGISNCSFSGYFFCLYRPPGINSSFFVDFHDLRENLVTVHPEFFILGDFNLHLNTQSTATSTFNAILTPFLFRHTFMVTGLIS